MHRLKQTRSRYYVASSRDGGGAGVGVDKTPLFKRVEGCHLGAFEVLIFIFRKEIELSTPQAFPLKHPFPGG